VVCAGGVVVVVVLVCVLWVGGARCVLQCYTCQLHQADWFVYVTARCAVHAQDRGVCACVCACVQAMVLLATPVLVLRHAARGRCCAGWCFELVLSCVRESRMCES
jgi:hypothetical protein